MKQAIQFWTSLLGLWTILAVFSGLIIGAFIRAGKKYQS